MSARKESAIQPRKVWGLRGEIPCFEREVENKESHEKQTWIGKLADCNPIIPKETSGGIKLRMSRMAFGEVLRVRGYFKLGFRPMR